MSKIIKSGMTIREGNVITMWNTERPKFSNEDKIYYFIWCDDGIDEFPIALTNRELKLVTERGKLVGGRKIPLGHVIKMMGYVLVNVNFDGKIKSFLFTNTQFQVAITRANKNTEDIPKKSLLTDLLD